MHSWAIGHHAGIVAYLQQNAEGAAMFATVQSGVKKWMALDIKEAKRETLADVLKEISSNSVSLLDYMDHLEVEMIHLHAGDLL